MESTLAGIGVSPSLDAVSVTVASVGASARSCSNPVRPAARNSALNSAARIPTAALIRTAPVVDTSSQGGVGSYVVQGPWRFELSMIDPMPNHKFTTHTRQGPPTCSPPA